jgi:hypothetical protein
MSARSLALLSCLLMLSACSGRLDDGPVGANGVTRMPPEPPVDCTSTTAIAPSDRAPRLTYDQYDRAVSDLLQLDLAPSTELPGDPGNTFTGTLVDGLEAAAADVASRLAADDAAFSRVVGCTPASAAEESACATTFVRTFGRRAYRRPLTTEEAARYDGLFTDRAMLTETGSFREGITLLVEAFVQSPGFLLRVERSTTVTDGRIPLSQYEVAQRLAFSLWGSVADDELLDAAEAGTLGSREGVLVQATRMLEDPRARALVTQEHRTWLGMESADGAIWSNVRRDARPEFAGVTDDDLHGDVLGSLEHVAFDLDGGLRELLTSPAAVVNARTAALYGLTGTFTDWTPVMLDANERPGLLTRIGFLASHARSTRSSLIYRGAFVVRHLLCEPIGNPPAGAESTPLPETAGLVTTRERIDAMTSGAGCANCHHERINPAGYALESFDEIGAFRALDNGGAVDTSGMLTVGTEALGYEDAGSFGTVLAETPAVQRCYAQRWLEFTYARPATEEDGCTASTLGDRLSEDGYSVRDMLADLVQTDAFLNRAATEAE